MMTLDPFQIAQDALQINRNDTSRTKTKIKRVADTSGWGAGDDVNMFLPCDAWNSKHWKRFFSEQFRSVYGHFYPSNPRFDSMALSTVMFRAREEYQMANEEIKEFLLWVGRVTMPITKGSGRIYFMANLKDDLNQFYAQEIHSRKVADQQARIKLRDLCIDNSDLRVAISSNIQKDETNKLILDFDPRLLTQFGVPMLLQYFLIQEDLDHEVASRLILGKVQEIITEDVNRQKFTNNKESPRFERIVKSSIEWEPYPWKVPAWREGALKCLIDFFGYKTRFWWKMEPPDFMKPASCLKILRSKKKS
jgi:hypothetical protein